MKLKKITGMESNPITFFSERVQGRIVKLKLNEVVEVPDMVGYEILTKYPDEVVKVDEKPPQKKMGLKPRNKLSNDYQDK